MAFSYLKRFLRLYAGLFLCAVSIRLAIQGGVGVTPWDVLHMGLADVTGISYGTVNILVGLLILTTSIVLGEKIGFGTLCNTLSVGYLVDFLAWLDVIPAAPNLLTGCLMMAASLFVLAMGSFLYIGAGMGCGPRDSMMTAFSKRLARVPVGLIRGAIETVVLVVGFFLGGPVGAGTVIGMFGIGPAIQVVFGLFGFDVRTVRHESVADTLRILSGKTAPAGERAEGRNRAACGTFCLCKQSVKSENNSLPRLLMRGLSVYNILMLVQRSCYTKGRDPSL